MIAASLVLATSTAAMPRYRATDAFVFSDGRVERVVKVRGDRITWAGLTGASYDRSRNFIVPVLGWRAGKGIGKRKVVGTPQQLWPLDKPRSVRFRVVAETRSKPTEGWRRTATLWTCKSLKPRKVTIKLGTYDTVPFSCDRYSATTMRLIERLEWDYAPALHHYVQRSAVDYYRGTRTTIKLVAALSGPAANRKRLAAIAREARLESRGK
ncbi:MAG: hypothetical protein HC788_01930 [Sphingopyxis sp.]|nr:hypothetical protein [Sphingopyxis sp.]